MLLSARYDRLRLARFGITRIAGIAALSLAIASCGGNKQETADQSAASSAPNATVDMANGATITGTIKLDGTAPQSQKYPTESDPVCKQAHPDGVTEDHWIVNNGNVSNAFIYIKDGLGNKVYAAPADVVTLDQKGCAYEPHVFGLVVGQKLKVSNSDQTLHNIHAHGESNEQFNIGQPSGTPAQEVSFTKPEVMVPIKCDVHGWMNSWAGILNHPFFAVSDKDGKYTIKGIPPGEYTIECWHEVTKAPGGKPAGYGVTATQKITVAAKDNKTLDFTIKPE